MGNLWYDDNGKPGPGQDIRGYTPGECYDQLNKGGVSSQFDPELDDRAAKWNSFNDD